jgi:hypothetical protein
MFERSYFMDVEKKKVTTESTVKVSDTKLLMRQRLPMCTVILILFYCSIHFFAKRSVVYCAWVSISRIHFHYIRDIKSLSRIEIGKFYIYIIWIYLCMSVSPPQFSSYVPCPFIATFVISPTNFQLSCIIMARSIECSLPTPKSV